jgi:hypothetical protein
LATGLAQDLARSAEKGDIFRSERAVKSSADGSN